MAGFKNRRSAIRSFDNMYEPKGMIGDPCVYCGEESDTMDHIPPITSAEVVVEFADEVSFVKVPACRECNSILGACAHLSIPARRSIVKERLKKRYRKLLSMPFWDEDDIQEVAREFANYIEKSSQAAEAVKRRMAWMRGGKRR